MTEDEAEALTGAKDAEEVGPKEVDRLYSQYQWKQWAGSFCWPVGGDGTHTAWPRSRLPPRPPSSRAGDSAARLQAARCILSRPGARTEWCVIKKGAEGALLASRSHGCTYQQAALKVGGVGWSRVGWVLGGLVCM